MIHRSISKSSTSTLMQQKLETYIENEKDLKKM